LNIRAYDRAAIKFRGVGAYINFNLNDYDDDLKQVREFSSILDECETRWIISCNFSMFCYLDEEFIERGVCANTSSTKQCFLKREFEVQRSNTAQMWPLGSSNGSIPW